MLLNFEPDTNIMKIAENKQRGTGRKQLMRKVPQVSFHLEVRGRGLSYDPRCMDRLIVRGNKIFLYPFPGQGRHMLFSHPTAKQEVWHKQEMTGSGWSLCFDLFPPNAVAVQLGWCENGYGIDWYEPFTNSHQLPQSSGRSGNEFCLSHKS